MNKWITIALLMVLNLSHAQTPLSNTFTYQGELKFNNALANGNYDFEFSVFDVATGGSVLETVTVSGVSVTNGVFTTPITLTTDLFTGNKIWLDIGVRIGGTGDPFDPLSPRQEVTSSPYAIHAQFVGANAVTGVQIQNGSVANVDMAGNSINSANIVDNSISSVDIAANAITDVELADNAVDTAAVQTGAINSAKILDGSVGGTDIDSTQVQRRISLVCLNEEYLAGINQDGSIICKRLPSSSSNLLDNIQGTSGSRYILNTSIAINQNNLPMISYYWVNGSVMELRMIACTNPSCSSANAFVKLDDVFQLGESKIVVPSNNLPVIAYIKNGQSSAPELQVISCTTADCSTYNPPVLLDSVIEPNRIASFGETLKLIIGSNGMPIMSYFTSNSAFGVTDKFLRVISCLQLDCSTFSPPVTLLASTSFTQTDIIVGPNGLPIVAVNDSVNPIVIVCTSLNCSTFNTPVVVPYSNGPYGSMSMDLNPNGLINIALGLGSTNTTSLVLLSCSVLDCSAITVTNTVVDSGGRAIRLFSKSNGKPIIFHYNKSTSDVRVVSCYDSTCDTIGSKITVDNTRQNLSEVDVVINQNGLPVFAYYYQGSHFRNNVYLKVYSCGNESCQK